MVPTSVKNVSESARTFLRAELRICRSFAELAAHEYRSRDRANRQQKSSRRAYDTIERLLPQLRFLSPAEIQQVRGELQSLQAKLENLGEKF